MTLKKVTVRVGDAVIVAPGVVHGWADIPDRGLFELPAIAERAAGWLGESDDREVMLSTLCFAPREDCAGRRLTLSGEG